MGNTTSGISFNAVNAAITSIDFNTNNNTTFTKLATGIATQLQHNSTTSNLTLFYSGVSNTAGTTPAYSTALQIEGGTGYAVFNRFTGFGGPAHTDSGRVSIAHNSGTNSPTLQLVEQATNDFALLEFTNQANGRV